MTRLRPTIALGRWSNITQIKSNMAAGRHLKNRYDEDSSILTKFGRFMRNARW